MDKKFLLGELKKCKSVDEILSSAKKLNYSLTKEEASKYFNQYCKNNEGALNEEELNNVAGGSSCHRGDAYQMAWFDSRSEVTFVRNVGDIVEVYDGRLNCDCTTTQCKIVATNIEKNADNHKYYDQYLMMPTKDYGNEPMSVPHVRGGWYRRSDIEM